MFRESIYMKQIQMTPPGNCHAKVTKFVTQNISEWLFPLRNRACQNIYLFVWCRLPGDLTWNSWKIIVLSHILAMVSNTRHRGLSYSSSEKKGISWKRGLAKRGCLIFLNVLDTKLTHSGEGSLIPHFLTLPPF